MNSQTQQYWYNLKQTLNTLDVYTKEETRALLLDNSLYKNYIGKAKNRTFAKENPKLYKSVLDNTQTLENTFKAQNTYKTSYNLTHRIRFIVELNYDIDLLKCKCGRTYNWTSYCRYCPEPKSTFKNKRHTEETKLKMRLSTIEYLNELKGQLAPRYNKDSIQIIEEYGKKHGYKFMHAENGGEYYVNELGYFLDAYDPIFKVALEVDEKHHFNNKGELTERDIIRQNQIEEKLGCTFIRIRYDRS